MTLNISLVGLGSTAESVMDYAAKSVSSLLHMPVAILPAQPEPAYAYLEQRGQYDAALILERLGAQAPADCARIVAITEADLCTVVLTFVFGAAEMNGKAVIVSLCHLRQEFYKLPPNQRVLQERLAKEIAHELGHSLGLTHCRQYRCVMNRADKVAQIDAKSADFCERCKVFPTTETRRHREI